MSTSRNQFGLTSTSRPQLSRLSFIQKIQEDSGFSISWNRVEENSFTVIQERRGPEEEAIDAFALTFRYFIQDNEQTSFRNMEKHFLSAPLDPILQQKFVQLRKEMNEHLDGETHINFNGEKLTRRRIMDVFVYGGLSHANEEKRRLWKTWMNSPVAAAMFENEFLVVLHDIYIGIMMIKNLNDAALKSLPGPS